MNVTITFDLTMLGIVGLNLIGILIYVARRKLQAHRLQRARARIVETVSAYFARTGVAVRAEAMAMPGTDHFIIIADTEPLKRFRHSQIVEVVLIEQVKKATGHIVDRVFWRFPLPAREGAAVEAPGKDGAAATPQRAPEVDEYLAQGLARLRAPEGLEVREESWAHFQEAVHEREEAHEGAEAAGGITPPVREPS